MDGILLQASYVGNLRRHSLRTPNINNAVWTQQGYIPVSPNPNTLACPAGINAAAYQCSGGFAPAGLSKDQIRPYLGYSTFTMESAHANSNYNPFHLTPTNPPATLPAMFPYTTSQP